MTINRVISADEDPLWLVEKPFRFLAPDRYSAEYRPDQIRPVEGLVYHYTAASRSGVARTWLTRKDEAFVSAHFVVGRDGTIEQLAPVSDRCFHAGGSVFLGKTNVNGRTIGIEIDNVGPLVLSGGVFWHYDVGGNPSRRFDGPIVCAGGPPRYSSRYWEAYSTEALEAVCRLTAELARRFPILATDPSARLVGHDDVDPKRKQDPGPAFPWELVRASVGGIDG